jgi:hypothetical protein
MMSAGVRIGIGARMNIRQRFPGPFGRCELIGWRVDAAGVG